MGASRARVARRSLSPSEHALARFAAAMVRRDTTAAARALAAARGVRAPRRGALETALMLVLYGGYPAALEALRVVQQAWPGRTVATREGTPAQWRARGAKLCARVYGPSYARLLPAVRALPPHLAVWVEEHGYGRRPSPSGLRVGALQRISVAGPAALR